MIEASGLRARSNRGSLSGVSFALHQGVHSFVGGADDGPRLLFSVLLGQVPLSSGSLAWDGERQLSPRVRLSMAHIPLVPPASVPLRVDELLRLACDLRAEPPGDPVPKLKLLGIESLSQRSVASLSPAEVRAVLLAEALSSRVVGTVLLEEPDVIAPPAAPLLHGAVSSWASAGRLCLVQTTSIATAVRLSETVLLLRRGALVRHGPKTDAYWARGDGGSALQIVAEDPRGLVRELAVEPHVLGIESFGNGVVIRGPELVQLSRALASAVSRAGANVLSIARCPAGISEVTGAEPPRPTDASGTPGRIA